MKRKGHVQQVKNCRQKLDIQILFEVENQWLFDQQETEKKCVKEFEETDSELSRLRLALVQKLKGNTKGPYAFEALLEECTNPLKHQIVAWKKNLSSIL